MQKQVLLLLQTNSIFMSVDNVVSFFATNVTGVNVLVATLKTKRMRGIVAGDLFNNFRSWQKTRTISPAGFRDGDP